VAAYSRPPYSSKPTACSSSKQTLSPPGSSLTSQSPISTLLFIRSFSSSSLHSHKEATAPLRVISRIPKRTLCPSADSLYITTNATRTTFYHCRDTRDSASQTITSTPPTDTQRDSLKMGVATAPRRGGNTSQRGGAAAKRKARTDRDGDIAMDTIPQGSRVRGGGISKRGRGGAVRDGTGQAPLRDLITNPNTQQRILRQAAEGTFSRGPRAAASRRTNLFPLHTQSTTKLIHK